MIVLLLVMLGLVLGSFVNALVWRLEKNRDWINDRSECTHCHHKLGPLDLVPVFSWIFLRGKCRYCHEKIEDSPLVELALPGLYVVSYVFWPVPLQGIGLFQFIAWLVFLVGFMALTLYDLRWFLLPNKIVFPLAGLAVVQAITVSIWLQDWRVLLTAAGGAAVISGLFYVIFQLSNGTWIGGGDVKLGIVLGILAGGVLESFLVIFTASMLGLIISVPRLIKGKMTGKTQIPFGPLLIAGLYIVVLFGARVVDWYMGLVYA